MRTPLCGRRLLKTLKGRKHMAVGSMLIHLSISEDEKEPRSATTLTWASTKLFKNPKCCVRQKC